MSAPLIDRRLAKRLTYWQAAMIVAAAVLGGLLQGQVGAKSAGLGALVYWLGSAFFAWQAFRTAGAQASKQIIGYMYLGMIGKFCIVIIGLALVLLLAKPIDFLALLGGLVLVQLMAWIVPFYRS